MYAHIADSYDELHGAEQKRKLSSLLAKVDISSYKSVLDVGCATAHLARYFPDHEYLGVDPCKELVEQAPSDVRVVVARGEDLPVATASFDVVLSLTALHNYTDPAQGVRELARVASELALIGVLKKAACHDEVLAAIQECFVVQEVLGDQHDTLVIARTRRNT